MSGRSAEQDREALATIEGAARTIGFRGNADLAQWVANVLADVRSERKALFDAKEATEQARTLVTIKQTRVDELTGEANELRQQRDAARSALSALQRELPPLREALEATNARNAELELFREVVIAEVGAFTAKRFDSLAAQKLAAKKGGA